MSSHRPYFKYSISQLEALFEKGRGDLQCLNLLSQELQNRNTDRAIRLGDEVSQALQAQPQNAKMSAPLNRATEMHEETGRVAASPQARQIIPVATPDTSASPPQKSRHVGPNRPGNILEAWTALEALSPQTYRRPEDLAAGDRRCVAELHRNGLPWIKGERSRPNRQLFYHVVLGAIPMDVASEELIRAFGADEEQRTRPRDKAAIGALLVDRRGALLEENGVAVSSFAWALPRAMQLRLGDLGEWPVEEQRIAADLESRLRRFDEKGEAIPLSLSDINAAHSWLVQRFALPDNLVEPPSFALRLFHYYKSKNPPEPLLLNSFFIGDLARASTSCRSGDAPAALRQYLGVDRPHKTFDLLSDRQMLEKAVAPGLSPPARWPSPGGHPLVMLQQAAVNLVRAELANKEGVAAVNGPPGTGKTTLLRDVVASVVLDRAMAMVDFEDPKDAFKASGERLSFSGGAFFHLYYLDPTLRGHEILVASSNNKAVENVSGELPGADAIGRQEDFSYFRSISDLLQNAGDPFGSGEGAADERGYEQSTWGLIAAVLGNSRNRAAFQQNFWGDKQRGFRTYLKAAKGDPVVEEITDEAGKVVERRTPSVVIAEKPPAPQEASRRWAHARKRLISLKIEVDGELEKLEKVRSLCIDLVTLQKVVAAKEAVLGEFEQQRLTMAAVLRRIRTNHDAAAMQLEQANAAVQSHRSQRPGLLARLFRTSRWRVWTGINGPLVGAASGAHAKHAKTEGELKEVGLRISTLSIEIAKAEADLLQPRAEHARISDIVDGYRRKLDGRVVDEAFLAGEHEAINMTSPWLPDSLHRKREDLFLAAMDVHRAFIDASAQKILHNISALMAFWGNGSPQDPAKRALLGDLWSTLFLVVPVLSTTFASVERMLGGLDHGSIGWLLIDEAGQALPQAAVGAIMRSKRAIIVGDPLQIPPVVTLPERLTTEICRFFGVDTEKWAAPEASAQALADKASRFQAAFRSLDGHRSVGIPLLVHRRCREPMFSISNRIAYDEQMVHAPPSENSPIAKLLGPSRWLDLDGDADSKWCPDEGELVIRMLHKIANGGLTDPDIFIISPFRIVAQELRRRIEREASLSTIVGQDARRWTSDRVGTIHTVQGREAEAVILVLGAPKASQNGARGWAAGKPNILNVAVSRAKQHLYVIGSYGAWAGVGHARELAAIPVERVAVQ